jgi:hypothetical protein
LTSVASSTAPSTLPHNFTCVRAHGRVTAFCSKESLAIPSTPSAQMWFFPACRPPGESILVSRTMTRRDLDVLSTRLAMCGDTALHGFLSRLLVFKEQTPFILCVSFFPHEQNPYLQIISPDLSVTVFVTLHAPCPAQSGFPCWIPPSIFSPAAAVNCF